MRNLWNIFVGGIFTSAIIVGASSEAIANNFTSLEISGSVATEANDINNNGVVVGTYDDASGVTQSYSYSSGGYDLYPNLGEQDTSLRGINDAGVVVGTFWTQSSGIPFRGFYDDGTTVSTIVVPGAVWNQTNDINNMGLGVGWYSVINGTTNTSGYIYDGTNFTTFAKAGADRTRPLGINDSGIVVGDYTESGNTYGFIYDGTSFTQLSVIDSILTSAKGIDNAGNIVGSYKHATGYSHGFIYDGNVFTTIDVDFTGAYSTKISGTNNIGQIVGSYKIDAIRYGFVGTSPVPVPASIFLLVSGLLGLFAMAKRKSLA